MRATGAHKAADANTVTGALRTTGALQAAGALRTTGAMRTAKPIAPGTGKARLVWPYVVLFAIAAGFLGVVYLWWRDTLFQHGHGALIVDIGEVLGLVGGYGVVILVALMARLPPLEKAVGTDRLARWHATGGRWVITAITGHVIFIIWGMSAVARKSVTGETLTLEREFPDILMATVAWLLLLMVAAFSMRAARRRIAYETWYYAHLYTYLAIALAFSHQFADGGAFAESLQARIVWSGLYVLVGGMLLWYRVSPRCATPPGTSSPCSPSGPRRRASCRCLSPAVSSTTCAPSPASSSAGGSSPVSCGGSPTPTRSPRCRSPI